MLREEVEENFYIYGTGLYASTFYSFLTINNLEDRVTGFIVSKPMQKQGLFCNRQVYGWENALNWVSGKNVYIAISPDKSKGLERMLYEAGARKVIQFTDELYADIETDIYIHYNAYNIENNQVAVWNFWGLGYSDQCKYIVEKLHEFNSSIKIYWLVKANSNYSFPKWIIPVEMGTEDFYKILSTSRIVISNVSAPNANYGVKRKEQYYIYTWHGIGPSKKIEWQSQTIRKRDNNDPEIIRTRWNTADLMIAGSNFCHEVYRKSFLYSGIIEDWGYPRNDIFFRANNLKEKVYEFFKIDENKKIVLYAPTFRNELMENNDTERLQTIYDINLKEVLKALNKRFGSEYFVLYRFHHFVYQYVDTSVYEQIGCDATYYPDMQELLVASDVLITDYSSSMWDFSLTRKPVFLYFNDAHEYEEKYNGFYVFPDNYPYPKGHTTEELCNVIESFNEDNYRRDIDSWFDKYGSYDDGHASERVANHILNVIGDSEKYGKN